MKTQRQISSDYSFWKYPIGMRVNVEWHKGKVEKDFPNFSGIVISNTPYNLIILNFKGYTEAVCKNDIYTGEVVVKEWTSKKKKRR